MCIVQHLLCMALIRYICSAPPQHEVTQQILQWKHPPGKKRPRVLGELLNSLPVLLGPSIIPPSCSLVTEPLKRSDAAGEVKRAYRRAVRLVHPDKIAGGAVHHEGRTHNMCSSFGLPTYSLICDTCERYWLGD